MRLRACDLLIMRAVTMITERQHVSVPRNLSHTSIAMLLAFVYAAGAIERAVISSWGRSGDRATARTVRGSMWDGNRG